MGSAFFLGRPRITGPASPPPLPSHFFVLAAPLCVGLRMQARSALSLALTPAVRVRALGSSCAATERDQQLDMATRGKA